MRGRMRRSGEGVGRGRWSGLKGGRGLDPGGSSGEGRHHWWARVLVKGEIFSGEGSFERVDRASVSEDRFLRFIWGAAVVGCWSSIMTDGSRERTDARGGGGGAGVK